MLPNYNKMSSNNDNANNNSNNNNNAASSSLTVIAQQSKNMLSAILPERVPPALSITVVGNNVEGRNTKITPTNSDDCPREGILDSTPNHNNGGTTTTSNNISYQSIRYAHLLTPSTMANYTTLTSRHRTGRRCYRLNLERPFNIHCEQSPLEYGDIFAPWDKSVRPVTKGPSEYCPPRHLGGGEEIWRRLVSFGRYGNDTLNNGNGPITNNKGDVNGESNNGGTKKGGMEGGMNLGWRKLTPHEVTSVERLGELNPQGEYSFSTYDLTHVKPRMKKQQLQQQQSGGGGGGDQQGGDKQGGTKQEGDNFREITPSTSIDSTSSDSDSNNPKSALLKANETARLFRRSELSLRLKAEEEAQKHAAQVAQRNAERNEREQAELNELKKIKGAKGISRRMSKRASLNGKKMLRKLSSSFGTTSTTSSGSSTKMMNYNGGIYEGGMGPHSSSRRRLVSTQAGMIEKAKDVIDEESEDEYDGEKYDDTKKIKNMSLFIVGEYDVLNDLCLDGGKRLKASQNLSDLDLLLQNDPCPPPNRWVRKTGWGKCNPSSMYAECPPKDFDWEKYLKKDGPVPVNPVPRPVMQVKS